MEISSHVVDASLSSYSEGPPRCREKQLGNSSKGECYIACFTRTVPRFEILPSTSTMSEDLKIPKILKCCNRFFFVFFNGSNGISSTYVRRSVS